MSRKPSDATMLRVARSVQRVTAAALETTRRERDAYRARATKAEQECAEWKARFDLLLQRTPEARP